MDGSCHAHAIHVKKKKAIVRHIWMGPFTHASVISRLKLSTRMVESRHTYQWVMSHLSRSHVTRTKAWYRTYECVTLNISMSHVTRMCESCHTCTYSCHIHEWVMSRIPRSHDTHMNESCHAYARVMPHIWMGQITSCHAHEKSCHTYDWVMSRIWLSHVTLMNESCHTYEWVISPHCKPHRRQHVIWMSHVTHLKSHAYKWVMLHIWLSHVTHIYESYYAYRWAI